MNLNLPASLWKSELCSNARAGRQDSSHRTQPSSSTSSLFPYPVCIFLYEGKSLKKICPY